MRLEGAVKISMDELDELVARVGDGETTADDPVLIKQCLQTLTMIGKILLASGPKRDIGARLHSLLGLESKKRKPPKKQCAGGKRGKKGKGNPNKQRNHGRLPASDYPGAKTKDVPHSDPELRHGGCCPDCGGTVYFISNHSMIRIGAKPSD